MSDPVEEGVIHRKRFLIVDGDREVLDSLERYLMMEAAPKVYKAKAPLAALRILQDDNTAVDCVICANKHGKISGMEFLQNLRTGRWGGPSVRDVNFILMMDKEDEAIIRTADSLNVTGYLFGELDRISAIETINKVLEHCESQSPLMKCPIAHVRLGGADVIAVAFDKSFGDAPQEEQQQTIQDIHVAAKECRIGGQVVPVWEDENGRTMFLAPSNYHAALKDISVDSVWRNLNREIPIKKTPHLRKEETGRGAKETSEEEQEETGPLRSLTHEDIGKVLLAFREVGADKFEKSFVQSQTIVERKPNSPFKPVMK